MVTAEFVERLRLIARPLKQRHIARNRHNRRSKGTSPAHHYHRRRPALDRAIQYCRALMINRKGSAILAHPLTGPRCALTGGGW
jgi:hypothetical protein